MGGTRTGGLVEGAQGGCGEGPSHAELGSHASRDQPLLSPGSGRSRGCVWSWGMHSEDRFFQQVTSQTQDDLRKVTGTASSTGKNFSVVLSLQPISFPRQQRASQPRPREGDGPQR